jgi:hypothetical protein
LVAMRPLVLLIAAHNRLEADVASNSACPVCSPFCLYRGHALM